jgi:predicted MFS family arabinose efflux permease
MRQSDLTEQHVNERMSMEVHRSGQRKASAEPGSITRRLVLVFAVACGMVVANMYYAQPILNLIARDFHVGSGAAGLVVTLTQAGFATGLFFIVPLGDLVNRRRMILGVLVVTTLAMLASAVSPSLAALIAFGLIVGLTTVVAQVLVPFAAHLARDEERGAVVGTVMSGLLLGILLARTFSGFVSQLAGWRAVYAVGAAVMVLLIVLLWHELPPETNRRGAFTWARYSGLLRSVGTLVREESLLRRRSYYGAMIFAAFSVLWTSIAFLLSRPPYSYNQAVIGVFGLVGVAGALAASYAGRLADRGLAKWATGGFLLLALVSFVLIGMGATLLIPLIFGILLLDAGVQGTHITNQSEIYRLAPEARSRITTAYMVTYFIGGAIGSATSAVIYDVAGWRGVSILGGAYIALALFAWLTELRPAR